MLCKPMPKTIITRCKTRCSTHTYMHSDEELTWLRNSSDFVVSAKQLEKKAGLSLAEETEGHKDLNMTERTELIRSLAES